jgi:leucyl-tRNA synthetase
LYVYNEVEKMSKSKYNVVNPDHVIDEYGADCFRMYEMFLGPIEQSKPWDMNGIDGVAKFLRRFWSLYASPEGVLVNDETATKPELKILHTAIKKVTEDIEKFSFNTSVSAFMICVNELKKLNCSKKEILEPLSILIAPFAPHLSEEIWQNILKNDGTVFDASFPSFDEQYLKDDEIDYPLCINGKKRAIISFPADENNANIENAAKSHPDMEKWLEGKTIKKVIIVPGKMINVVA